MGDHFTNVDPSACKVKWHVAYVIKGIEYWRDIDFSELIETALGAGRSSLIRRELLDAHTSDGKRKHGWRDDAYVGLVSRNVVCLHSGRVNKIRRVHIIFCA